MQRLRLKQNRFPVDFRIEAVKLVSHMDTKLLEDFISLSKTLNFSRSAEERCISQSAFSRRIKALELWAGTPLIDRDIYPIEMTAAGIMLKGFAQKILHQININQAEMHSLGWADASPITIASSHSLALNFFPKWLRKIDHVLSENTISMIPSDSFNCLEALIHGDVNFIIVFSHTHNPVLLDEARYPYCLLGIDSYYPVSAVDDRGQALFDFPTAGRAAIPYLAYPASIFLGKVVLSILQQTDEDHRLKQVYENEMANGLKAMAIQGFGLAWLPESIILNELKAGLLKRVGNAQMITHLEIRLYKGNIEGKKSAMDMWQNFLAHKK